MGKKVTSSKRKTGTKSASNHGAPTAESAFRSTAKLSMIFGVVIGFLLPLAAAATSSALWGGTPLEASFTGFLFLMIVPAGIVVPIIMLSLLIGVRKKYGDLPNDKASIALLLLGVVFCQMPFLLFMLAALSQSSTY